MRGRRDGIQVGVQALALACAVCGATAWAQAEAPAALWWRQPVSLSLQSVVFERDVPDPFRTDRGPRTRAAGLPVVNETQTAVRTQGDHLLTATPLEGMQVVGVVVQAAVATALLQIERQVFAVRAGDALGPQGGRIQVVSGDGLLVRWSAGEVDVVVHEQHLRLRESGR